MTNCADRWTVEGGPVAGGWLLDGDDVLLRTFIHGPRIDEPRSASLRAGSFCMLESPPLGGIEAAGSYAGTYYYHYDALGSVVALSDADGDTVQVYEYVVYGQVAASDPNHPNRFLFTGREFDKETGLYYYRARYYNPTIGRFLQTDPIGYGDGMNMYAYCLNAPLSWNDPLGLEPVNPIPPTEGYELYDEAVMAASIAIRACQKEYPWLNEDGWEFFCWLYEYRNPYWRPGTDDPCVLFGFTLPVVAEKYQSGDIVPDREEKKVPSGATVIGALHTHPSQGGDPEYEEGHSRDPEPENWDDRDFIRAQVEKRQRRFHSFCLSPTGRLYYMEGDFYRDARGNILGTVLTPEVEINWDSTHPPSVWYPGC